MNEKRPYVEISVEHCKGCELCVSECPKNVLEMSDKINHLGYTYVNYTGDGCIGCGFCFYACPEPSTITVYKKEKKGKK